MKGKAFIIVGFLAAAALIFVFARRDRGPNGAPSPAASPVAAGPTVTMMYSTEKRAFIEEMAAAFAKEHPEIHLQLSGVGSLEAADRILDGKDKPMVFSPADSLVLGMLADDWQTKNGAALFAPDGDEAPQPMLITPLVFAAWADRAAVLDKSKTGRLTWTTLRAALGAPKGWAALGGDGEWGFVKLGHTDPTRSNSGLQALVSMAIEQRGLTRPLAVSDLLDPELQAFIRDIEKGVTKFEASTGTFMTDMVRFGPSKYDVALVYESLAITQIENARGRWGDLRVYYPTPSIWSDHPLALVDPTHLAPADKQAALTWIRFLRARPAQERALAFGFRPADPAVPLKSPDPQNPFHRLAPFGIRVDLPPAAATPAPAVVRNLLTFWSRLGLR